jgi:hypothetical protein
MQRLILQRPQNVFGNSKNLVKYNLKIQTPAANTVLAKMAVQRSANTFVVKTSTFDKS